MRTAATIMTALLWSGGPALAATPAPAPASAAIAAAPMKSPGPVPTYPRLTAFPDAGVKSRVNALLAAKEKEDRGARTDCLAQSKAQKQKGSYEERTEVTYLSPRYLNVAVTSSYDCASAYPNDGIQTPLTLDLATGKAVDWDKLFKPGFLPPDEPKDGAPASALTKLYRARYPKDADKDCKDLVTGDDPFSGPPILWLDAKRGLVAKPDFPHVTQACAEEVAIPATALSAYVRDPAALADLQGHLKR